MGTLFNRSYQPSDKSYRVRAWAAAGIAALVLMLALRTARDYPHLAALMTAGGVLLILLALVFALKGATKLKEDIARLKGM